MCKGFVVLLLTLLIYNASAQQRMTNFFVAPRIGWAQEKLNWNIAGDEQGNNPSVLSELIWEELRGPAFEIASGIELLPNLSIRGQLAYQRITVGRVSDTDYAEDDRTWQTARFDLRANQGHTLNYRLALLYQVWSNGRFSVRPQVGYFGRRQTLFMLDGDVPLLPDRELRSTYEPRWNGALLGVEIRYRQNRFDLSYDIAASRVMQYAAEASWNLQEDFRQPVSFVHRAKGNGWESSLTAGYRLNAAIRPFLYAGYSQLVMRNGSDELYRVDGQVLNTRLNGVNASGIRVGAGVQLSWRSTSTND
ncbi:omptin family outer membrane protease [Sphingobacterium paludis]|uniref:Omptin family protein n=1 Tax=Sphingobacterium paludis TaxID=1476465 RepID=A0A4R7CYX3_9SPHI|nr:omptin family outer membrane protease [Sphingobacterium paludis]TDS12951.1 omptin family protein [Sphingobacterium paludis]